MLALPGPIFDVRSGVKLKDRTITVMLNDIVDGTGGSFWDASVILLKFFENNPDHIFNKKVLELGSGLGITSIAVKVLGASHVISSDLADVLPGIQKNLEINDISLEILELD